jgi:aspartyl-tRNA(Asn)/glutamyl-tRNA(Gln) amidotransferase subunit A
MSAGMTGPGGPGSGADSAAGAAGAGGVDGAATGPLRGSIASASFEEALRFLEEHRPRDARRRVPFDIAPPEVHVSRPVPQPPPAGELPAGSGPLSDAARAIRAGEVSCTELLAESLEAVAKHNHELGAIVALDEDAAVRAAEQADAMVASGAPLGQLHGIPITVKDVIDVAGLPTRCASAVYEDHPTEDAVGVARLRAAGANLFAKAATHEFALGVTSPQSRNPWDTTRIPGGSSGGSAAAVASGMGLASLGTDTRASIRVPTALSGLVGFKPTYGRIPTDGVVSLSWTMDHVAPMATTVRDAATMLEVLLGDGRSLAAAPAEVGGLRVGVSRAAFEGASDRLAKVVDGSLAVLADAGALVESSTVPDDVDLDTANFAGLVVSRVEAASFHRGLDLGLENYWEEVADQIGAASTISGADYLDAQRVRVELTDRMVAAFDHHDLLAMPTVVVTAPPADDFARFLMLLSRNAIPWSFVGFPVISVPCGTVDGLPVGLQLVAPPDREDLLVSAAAVVEANCPMIR